MVIDVAIPGHLRDDEIKGCCKYMKKAIKVKEKGGNRNTYLATMISKIFNTLPTIYKQLQTIILLVILCLTLSCSNTNKKIIGSYYFTNDEGNQSLAFKMDNGQYIDVVTSSVFSIAHDKNFIIVKQHPQRFSQSPNKSVTNYFIVPLLSKINTSPDLNVYGPLNENAFLIKKRSLKISNSLTLVDY